MALIKELEFILPTAFHDTYIDVACRAQMIEPGEIADIILLIEHPDKEGLISAIYQQHGDSIIECMGELFK